LDAWSQSYFAEELAQFKNVNPKNFHLNLRPLAECHYNVSGRWGHFTNAKNLYQLGCLVIVILLIASLNYVLLAVSNAASRSQEIGVRKVLGANRRAIVFQYWVETQIVVGLALLCGLLLAWPAVPLFDRLMDTQMQTGLLGWKEIVLSVLAIGLLMGVIAGYYPALLISRMKPTSIIKSFRTFRVNPKFSRFLVVLQYTGCVVLMMAAFVVNRQMHYVSNKDLGFDKEQVLMVKNPTWDFDFSQRLHARLENLALTLPSVSGFSAMNGGLIGAYNRNGFTLHGEQQWLNQMTVDYQYFEMLGLPFVQGRPFSKAYAEDSSRSVRPCVVNESLFRLLGPEARIGVYNEAIRGKIIGVVRDYHYASLSQKIEPEMHVLGKQYFQYFLFKVRPGTMQGTIEKIRQGWKEIGQNYPFEYDFLDQTISHMYEPEIRWQQIVLASCYFALFIACLGLFGLSSINAVNRTKEIGIRKVLGASVRDVVSSLSSNFVVLVVLSIVIAIPLAWWMMNNWLEDFAYRIIIEWWMFALVGLSALLIAFLAVSLQAVKAALANPVDSLRTE
jgi:putative ABC transport system permease protein